MKKLAILTLFLAGPATAQGASIAGPIANAERPAVVAVPPLPTPANSPTDAGETGVLGRQIADLIVSNLRSSGVLLPLGPDGLRIYSFPEASAPAFPAWRASGAKALVTGFVQARPDGRLTVGCYLHDIAAGREIGRNGFVVVPADWRRAAHRCADAVYARLSGASGIFDSRIVYVAESGPRTHRIKRLAVMDADGSSHRYLTPGHATVLTPRMSPDGSHIALTSFVGRQPQVYLMNVETAEERAFVAGDSMSFAPSFSPDGKRIALSIATGGNSDIHIVDIDGGVPQRLTTSPGTDTAPSFSPDGSHIVFESDRSGSPQLYVMNADGSDQRRISFGVGRHAAPAWSPSGEWIAFTRIYGGRAQVGVMTSAGSEERILTDGWKDEQPGFAPNGQYVIFQRTEADTGRTALYAVPREGGAARLIGTPQGASDPNWSAAAR